MKVLAIETSCDETAAAVVEKRPDGGVWVLGEAVASSEELHGKTGGIVPEVAARKQLELIMPTVAEAVKSAMTDEVFKVRGKSELGDMGGTELINPTLSAWMREQVDAVAVTKGPGLIGSLLVGVESAKALALAWDKPLIGVNHLWGHVYANWIVMDKKRIEVPDLPAVALIVSGGHTELLWIKSHGQMEILGSTRDDAAGECLDKCARILELPYPGGKAIAEICGGIEEVNRSGGGALPKPLLNEDTYDFSFSGLKVAVARLVEPKKVGSNGKIPDEFLKEVAGKLEETVVEILVKKVVKAVEAYQPKSVLLGGGVAANERLRKKMRQEVGMVDAKIRLWVPEVKYCTDNAAMIGAAGCYRSAETELRNFAADPGLTLRDVVNEL